MRKLVLAALLVLAVGTWGTAQKPHNPIIFADVPDASMIRVGDTYYMSSTTMHMNPGLPIMKSTDLVHWEMLRYAYQNLGDREDLRLEDNKNMYGKGTWASSLRFHKGVFYVSTFSQTTNKTYIFRTNDLEKGNWEMTSFSPSFHDHTLFFDEQDRPYLIYGSGTLKLVPLADDLTGVRPGSTETVVIENASAPAGKEVGLPAEGAQLFKVKGKYYLFTITWPRGGMRTVQIHRADDFRGPWEGRVALQDRGVAQGGLIDTPDGRWFAYLFRDYGAVGRIPYLAPVTWQDGWPVVGVEGKVPDRLDLPDPSTNMPAIVASDEFNQAKDELPLVWQWNHNPDQERWSLTERPDYLRLRTGRLDERVTQVRNVLTQRTFGPKSTASTRIELAGMKNGDRAGLVALQSDYGWVAVEKKDGQLYVVSALAPNGEEAITDRIPLHQNDIYLRVSCDFTALRDEAQFFYSLDGAIWEPVGTPLKMKYKLTHFMGYRFGLFNYATLDTGGYADFDWFRIMPK